MNFRKSSNVNPIYFNFSRYIPIRIIFVYGGIINRDEFRDSASLDSFQNLKSSSEGVSFLLQWQSEDSHIYEK